MICLCKTALTALAFVTCLNIAEAQHLTPIPHPVGAPQPSTAAPAPSDAAAAQSSWTPLTNQPTFLADGASNPILLTDGSVLIQDAGFPDWWKLKPDQNGSYIKGKWTKIASLPPSYSPLYHSTAVLPDGRMIIEGGEYLLDSAQTQFVPTWTAEGAIYDPLTNKWTMVAPPSGWLSIGDAQSVILEDGTYMQANCCTREAALLNPRTLSWTPTGNNKFDLNDEEGWTLLPNGHVLTVDSYLDLPYDPDGTHSELYNPATKDWHSAGRTIAQLWDSAEACGGQPKASYEVGPAVLRPDGTVFYTGANSCGAAKTAIYNSHTRTWTQGPRFPNEFEIADGPAALEPNGKVLMMAARSHATHPSQFFEWDGHALTAIANTPNAPFDNSFYGNMLVLPTGQILVTDFSNDIEIYTPKAGYDPDWAPVVHQVPDDLYRGKSYKITGRRFNGMSQGAAYGDDVQAATNYPLVRVTNIASGHVFYSRTHHHSSMAVASDDHVCTHFDVPAKQETGLSRLEVVANGIPSRPVTVHIY
jgi:hypothetical protein